MNVLPPERFPSRDLEGLRAFLDFCRNDARQAGTPRLASISLEVAHIEPLAVLQSVFDPEALHFYAERPGEARAVAAAEAVLSHRAEGAGRFAAARAFHREVRANTIAIGDLSAPQAGSQVFFAFGFYDAPEPDSPFAPATCFVPRWQVARQGERFSAVANCVVTPDADIDWLADRIWSAHEKFHTFDYAPQPAVPETRAALDEDTTARATYRAQVGELLAAIERGELQKAVLARVLTGRVGEGFRPFAPLYELRERFPACTSFSIGNGVGACFLGATPERLLRSESGQLATEAIAGTRPRGTTPSEDARLGQELLRSDKDQREHAAVVEAISGRLREVGLQPSAAARPGLLRLRNVQHLITPIRATAGGVAFFDAIAALHPTPAIGGLPRDTAIARLRQLEPFARGLFAGALGWVDAQEQGEALVGIRCALVDGQHLQLYAGAGIVHGSDPAAEDAEVAAKLQALRSVFFGA